MAPLLDQVARVQPHDLTGGPELWTGCAGTNENGQPCRAPKLRESEYCLMHSPEHAEEMAEARRLGGLGRRREVAVSGAYQFAGLQTVADIRRILEVAVAGDIERG